MHVLLRAVAFMLLRTQFVDAFSRRAVGGISKVWFRNKGGASPRSILCSVDPAETPPGSRSQDVSTISRPLIVCGPSGVGKGTLIKMLLKEYPDRFGFSVSHTTRAPRPGEIHGVHYFYTTREALEADVSAGKFLEHANVHGNIYGTSFDAIRSVTGSGKICILDIDIQGVVSIKQAAANGLLGTMRPIYVFIAPPSMQVLEARLRGRDTEEEADLQKRLDNGRKELELGMTGGMFDRIVVNGKLNDAYADLKQYIREVYGVGGCEDRDAGL